MAVRTRRDVYQCDTRIDTTHIVPASSWSSITGFIKKCSPTRPSLAPPCCGESWTACYLQTYRSCAPRTWGLDRQQAVMGKHSGPQRVPVAPARARRGHRIEEQLNSAFAQLQALAGKKHEVFDELQALMNDDSTEPKEHYRLVSSSFHSETGEQPCARVTLAVDGRERRSPGCQPASRSAFKAIEHRRRRSRLRCARWSSPCRSAPRVRSRYVWRGMARSSMARADTGIIVASARLPQRLNKLGRVRKLNPQV